MYEYVEKIMGDENLLRSYKGFPKSKNAQEIASIMNDLKNSVFGSLLPSELEDKKSDVATGGKDIKDMPPLEDEKPIGGKGLKIMTPAQLITRLSTLLSQIKAGNNSEKLKNEIRQILYSLYRSKNLTKTVYDHLISSI